MAGEPVLPEPSSTCPFGFAGARVAVEDTKDGADVIITGIGNAREIRQRAKDSAAMFGPGAHRGIGHHGTHGDGQRHGLGLATLSVPVRATEEDIDEGARIHVTPVRAEDRDRMRGALLARAENTRTGACD
jgi:hypothetical protein